jgi:hypothetical protein
MTSRYKPFSFCTILAAGLLVAGSAFAGPKVDLDVPTIECVSSTPSSITIRICAGPSGAPGGISVHWITCDAYNAGGGSFDGGYAISLSGNCPTSNWDLGPGECRDLTFNATTVDNENAGACGASGDQLNLLCNTCYAFEVFAHQEPGPGGLGQSGKSDAVFCSTAPCPTEGNCTLTWGYWKTHGPVGCNPPNKENLWPVSSLNVGGLSMGEGALCGIFQTNPGACSKGGTSNSGSNAVIILEHQLIAAKLNMAAGAIDCSFADAAIAQADALLNGFEYACVGTSTPLGQQMVAVATVLESYNSDNCACPVQQTKPQASPTAPSNAKKASWGQLKSIYR